MLSVEEEAVIVAFRRYTLLPLDDCLYALQPTIPHLTRSSLHRCLQRHGIGRLPDVEGDKPTKKKFKAYPIGYFHIDIAETVQRVPTAAGVEICPGPAGAKEWNHASYSRATGFLYAPVIEMCATFHTVETEFRESLPYWGGEAKPDPERRAGFVKAFDPLTGGEIWAWRTEHPVVASLLTTAGGLVFVGRATGEFMALDAQSGAPLWQFQTGSGIHGSPVAYSIAGKQYIAVPSGWGGWMKGFAPELYGAPRGNALFVFSLP